MLNQVILVGRLERDVESRELEDGKKVYNLLLAIPRSYKNADSEYDTDYLNIKLLGTVGENTSNYCKKGDIVGVKGRIQNYFVDNIRHDEIIAEKVTFLSSKKKED